jgi:hypothetical protein
MHACMQLNARSMRLPPPQEAADASEEAALWSARAAARGEAARLAARYRLVGMMADEGDCPASSGEGLTDNETSSGDEEEDDCELEAAGRLTVQHQLQRIHRLQARIGERTQQLQQEQQQQSAPHEAHVALPGPVHCSFLSQGQSFTGSQRLSNAPVGASEDWQVRACSRRRMHADLHARAESVSHADAEDVSLVF